MFLLGGAPLMNKILIFLFPNSDKTLISFSIGEITKFLIGVKFFLINWFTISAYDVELIIIKSFLSILEGFKILCY